MSIINTIIKPVENGSSLYLEAHVVDRPMSTENNISAEALGRESSEPFSIKSYFASKGFTIDVSKPNTCVDAVEDLAVRLATNYRACKPFLKYLRDNIAKKCFHISYSLSQTPEEEKETLLGMIELFGEYGILFNLFHNRNADVINGFLSSAPRVINFLNGDFLEFFGRIVAEDVVKAAAEKYDVDSEIYSNAIVSREIERHELDMVFRVGETVFWSEIKSGNFSEFDTYRKLGIRMGVNPNKHILLSAEATEEAAQGSAWFHQLYVSNIEQFRSKLAEMIDNAFAGGKNND